MKNNDDVDVEEIENLGLLRKQIWNRRKIKLIKEFGDVPALLFIVAVAIWVSLSACLLLYYSQFDLLMNMFILGHGDEVIWSYALIALLSFLMTIFGGMWSLYMYEAKIRLKIKDKEKDKSYVEKLLEE